jgi:D-glycero-D-manno-heptose 1,7-bisphosphate phosphatase
MADPRQGAVFLDRDGTLIEEVGYLDRVERVELYPWTIDAVRSFNRAGFRVVLVSNQSGVARGFFTEAVVDDVHRYMAELLAAGGARIDAYYYCPHHPDGKVAGYALACDCRKPNPGLVERAVRELGVDPARSFVVGDRWLDVALARRVGARGVLVRTGYGATEESKPPAGLAADAVADNLIGAAGWILKNSPC